MNEQDKLEHERALLRFGGKMPEGRPRTECYYNVENRPFSKIVETVFLTIKKVNNNKYRS